MLYSVQNAGGEVYGMWPLPQEPGYSAQEWAEMLHGQLADIEGVNGICVAPLRIDSDTTEVTERVVVDIEPWDDTGEMARFDEVARLERVHRTVGMIASGEDLQVATETIQEREAPRRGRFLARILQRT